MPATLYLDTEFNGFNGSLISLALIGSDDRIFYEIQGPISSFSRVRLDPWVQEHVMPFLRTEKFRTSSGREALHPDVFKPYFQRFLSTYDNPIIIADWFADLQHFLKLLEGPDYGSSLNFKGTLKLVATPDDLHSEVPHNALSDAIALRKYCIDAGL